MTKLKNCIITFKQKKFNFYKIYFTVIIYFVLLGQVLDKDKKLKKKQYKAFSRSFCNSRSSIVRLKMSFMAPDIILIAFYAD